MVTDLARVHWPSFSIALRVSMVSHTLDDEGVAQVATVSAGAVQRARCGQPVSALTFKRLCTWMDRDPHDFYDPARLPAAGLLETRGGPKSDLVAADDATPRTAAAATDGGAGAAPASQGSAGATRIAPASPRSSSEAVAQTKMPATGSFDR